MKKFLLLACVSLLCAPAIATDQLPTVYEITGHVCGSPPKPQSVVIGTNPDGTQAGYVFAWTACSAGGRGGGTTYDSGCVSVLWTNDGQMISYEVLWRQQGRYVPPATSCWG